MVITRVNGIALAGMGDAVAKLLGSGSPVALTLETAAGYRFSVATPR